MAATAAGHSEKQTRQEEWIFVKSKSRFRKRNPPPKKEASAKFPNASTTDEPRTHKSVAEITAEYESFKARWRDTTCHDRIRHVVRAHANGGRRIRRAVCLGVGTFDPEDGGWDAKRRSYIQLDAFLTVVQVLSEIYNDVIPCSFQEPRFTPNDTAFLTNLGHKVVESPAAFEAVDEDSLVFAIHMYRPIYEAALQKAVPAMFVGTGWHVWDATGTMKDGEFKCMSDMHSSHKQVDFPQDGTYTTFSSTCLYWRPKPGTSPTALALPLILAPENVSEEANNDGTEKPAVEKDDKETPKQSSKDDKTKL